MATMKYGHSRDAVDWDSAIEELENFGRRPSSEELREAMLDTVEVFNQGHLTEDELKQVLTVLAGQVINLKVQNLLLNFGRGFTLEPSFTRRRFKLRHTIGTRSAPRNVRLSRV